MKNKRRNKLLLLLILLLGVSIGFALLSTTLKINGVTGVKKNTWSVYWDSLGDIVKTEDVVVNQEAAIDQDDNTLVSFNVLLNIPGDYYEFQVDAVNAGTLNAMLDIVSVVVNGDEDEELPDYLEFSVKYADDVEPVSGHLLEKADFSTTPPTVTRERYKIRIKFKDTITPQELENIPDENYSIQLKIPYKQADDTATDRHAESYTYYYFDTVENKQVSTTNRSIINRNEYVRENAAGTLQELCMVTTNKDICFSTSDYDWECNDGCTYNPQGAKTLALVSRFTAEGIPVSNENSGLYAGDSSTKMCTADGTGYINCFSSVSVNENGKYCYCSINSQSPISEHCNCREE